jgi:hypothetical protein
VTDRRLPIAGIALVLVETIAGALGAGSYTLSFAVLVVAPGLALSGLLPRPLRTRTDALLCAAPALGFAATSVGLISIARLGIPLEAWSIRGLLLVLCGLGFLLGRCEPSARPDWRVLAGLGGAVVLGVVLGGRVVGDAPVPGNDWAKYVLYADEIRRQGALLIDNPFWMLGVPFREDPATPAVLGAALELSGAEASAVVHSIQAFAVMGVLGIFALVRSAWSGTAACLAAALYAAVPVNHDILGWHGLPNVAALALVPLALAHVTAALQKTPKRAEIVGLALVLVALTATHRLTTVVTVPALGLAALAALVVLRERRGELLRTAAATLGLGALLGALTAWDLLERQSDSGGTQAAVAYRLTRINVEATIRDLTIPFAIAAVLAVGYLLLRRRAEVTTWPLLALLAVTVGLAYAWLVDVPLSYLRMVYFLPLALAPLTGIWLASLRPRIAVVTTTVLLALMSVFAWEQAANVRSFYAFTGTASLRGLDGVAAQLRPGEVVVTDRCWSFLATWLLHTPTLAALAPEDIGPAAEVPFAARARAIFRATPEGRRDAQQLGVRFILVDPTCVDAENHALTPPLIGDPVYVSRRLAVIRLSN